MPYAAILSAGPLTQLFASIQSAGVWRWVRPGSALLGVTRAVEQRERGGYSLAWCTLVGCVLLAASIGATRRLPLYNGEIGPPSQIFPTTAVNVLLSRTSPDDTVTVLNTADWSGYLTWRGYPKLKPVIDDRNTLLGEAFYRRFYEVVTLGGDLPAYLAEHRVRFLLLHSDSALARVLKAEGRYPVVHQDPLAVVFEVVTGELTGARH